jgi:hypothetical protein
MKNNGIIWVVSSSFPAEPEDARKFFHWLENIHIPDLLKFKGLIKATCYRKVTEVIPLRSSATGYPGYITTYEFENKQACKDYATSPERAAAIKDGMSRWPAGGKKVWSVLYEPIKTVEKKVTQSNSGFLMMCGVPLVDSTTGKEFQKWVDEVYFNELVKYKGLRNARSFRLAADVPPLHITETTYPPFLTLFEYESNQASRDFLTSSARAEAVEIEIAKCGPDFGASQIWAVIYEPTKTVEKTAISLLR